MDKLIVSTSPHIRHKRSCASIMGDVIIALIPAAIASVIFFGFYAAIMIAICVGCAVASEFIFNLICKKKQTVGTARGIFSHKAQKITQRQAKNRRAGCKRSFIPIWQ